MRNCDIRKNRNIRNFGSRWDFKTQGLKTTHSKRRTFLLKTLFATSATSRIGLVRVYKMPRAQRVET